MREILIFAGTTEGRKLSEYLIRAKVSHTICVATEYGEIVLTAHPLVKVHQGRMNEEEIEVFLKKGNFVAVIDATHPYAQNITHNIKGAIEKIKNMGIFIPYLRLKRDDIKQREKGIEDSLKNIRYFDTNEMCAKALENIKGNILLTTGSKELAVYCVSEKVKERIYVRALPSVESISLCMEQGIYGKQIIAMQGPFTKDMNEAIIRQYQISLLITKESGISGGYVEKLEAAKKTGTQVFVIGRPKEKEGYFFSEICNQLEGILGKKLQIQDRMEIILAGIGMGNSSNLTKEVEKAVGKADILLGAERMLANVYPKLEKRPYYLAEQIIPYLREVQERNPFMEYKKVVILFSGDSGFYSGCQSLYRALKREAEEGRLRADINIMPGISSVSYLASCIGESYHDGMIYSIHGKKLYNITRKIKSSPKTFLLTSGVKDINWLGKMLVEENMLECEIVTGYQLSYEEQQIKKYTPLECCSLEKEGLYTCFVKNPYPINRKLTPGIRDEQFMRDKVPMTKEEVREVSICKLGLYEGAIVYDIGSGTGSVAVEIGSLSDNIQVYAIEQKKEALCLIEKNKEKFGLQNINVIEATAPEGFSSLPKATHAFIGGSKGKMKEILTALKKMNPKMRVVLNAVSIETISEMKEILSMEEIKGEEIVQLQTSRVKKIGNYHLMQAENPIWIFAFDFVESKQPGGQNED